MIRLLRNTIIMFLLIHYNCLTILSQGIYGGGTNMRPTNAYLDSLNTTLRAIGKLYEKNLIILDTTIQYSKQELIIVNDLNENMKILNKYSEQLPTLISQLVILAEDNKQSSARMERLNRRLTF